MDEDILLCFDEDEKRKIENELGEYWDFLKTTSAGVLCGT
jgi:hypothetical protein